MRMYRRKFIEFLKNNKGRIVGNPTKVTDCPLCHYLKDAGADDVRMEYDSRVVDGEPSRNARWAIDFQHAAADLQVELDVTGLRGREALRVMEELP